MQNKISKEQERQEAIARLREWVKPGDTVYTILRHVSSSGMLRVIDCKIVDKDSGRIFHLGHNVAKALGIRWDDKREGMRVGGCGMDMGYHIVYGLASVLYRDNFYCIGENCPSNDHANGDVTREEGIKTHYKHSDGGYSLNHSWL